MNTGVPVQTSTESLKMLTANGGRNQAWALLRASRAVWGSRAAQPRSCRIPGHGHRSYAAGPGPGGLVNTGARAPAATARACSLFPALGALRLGEKTAAAQTESQLQPRSRGKGGQGSRAVLGGASEECEPKAFKGATTKEKSFLPTSGWDHIKPRSALGRGSKNAELIAASRPEPRLLPGAGAHPACRTLGRPRRIRGTSGVRRLGHHRRAGAPSPTRCPSRRGRWVPAGWAQGG